MATLSFKTQFPWGDQTYFIPKIWKGLIDDLGMYDEYMSYIATVMASGNEKLMEAFIPVKDINTIVPKIHTIREDKHDFWKPGRKIHMAVFNRTKNRFQFAPALECKSVQRIEITHTKKTHTVKLYNYIPPDSYYESKTCTFPIPIDYSHIAYKVKELVQNDGFNSVEDFFRFFSQDFKGKIIHWTEYKY